MPRRPRVHLDWVPVHILQRGHNRGACFFDDQDRHAYLGWRHGALRREGRRLHTYVLMTNHVTCCLPRRTPTWFRGCRSRWAGATCSTPTALTGAPARSGTVATSPRCPGRDLSAALPARYRAQSGTRGHGGGPGRISLVELLRRCLGRAEPDPDPPSPYRALGPAPGERLEAYRNLFRIALADAPLAALRMALNQSQPLDNDRFYAEIQAVMGRRREPRKRGRPKKERPEERLGDKRQQELSIWQKSADIRA